MKLSNVLYFCLLYTEIIQSPSCSVFRSHSQDEALTDTKSRSHHISGYGLQVSEQQYFSIPQIFGSHIQRSAVTAWLMTGDTSNTDYLVIMAPVNRWDIFLNMQCTVQEDKQFMSRFGTMAVVNTILIAQCPLKSSQFLALSPRKSLPHQREPMSPKLKIYSFRSLLADISIPQITQGAVRGADRDHLTKTTETFVPTLHPHTEETRRWNPDLRVQRETVTTDRGTQ